MPDPTTPPPAGDPGRRPLKATRDAWESVIRQELARLRRHRFQRSRMTPGRAAPAQRGAAKPPAVADEPGA
jgi:hypothetical protein